MISKEKKKSFRKFIRRMTRKEVLWKVVVIVSSIALVATSVLPYILR